MNKEEIIALTKEELVEKITTEKEMLQKLTFAHAVSPVENPMKIKHSRKLIARLKTRLQAVQSEENKVA